MTAKDAAPADANGLAAWFNGVVTSFGYGNPGDLPIAGDWDGDEVIVHELAHLKVGSHGRLFGSLVKAYLNDVQSTQ